MLALAATLTAERRFRGPSEPAWLALRIAPVITTGCLQSKSKSSANALSSMVSVPWVTTTPSTPSVAIALRMVRANRAAIAGVMSQLGMSPNS
jgi:hypothetical protein